MSLGTSGTIFISSENFGVDPHNALHAFAHADGHYHLMGCMLSAASCNKWWMDTIIGTKDYGKEQEAIENLGENHVFFLPYLMGERSPHNDPQARGTFIGMSMDTSRADMTQAVLEGVAFAIRDSFEIAISGDSYRENQDLRRWSEESAVEEDHCQCIEHQSGPDRFRGGTGAWRCDACCSCGWNLCIGGSGSCKDRKSGGNRRTGPGDRRKIRDTVSEICADLSDGEVYSRSFPEYKRNVQTNK